MRVIYSLLLVLASAAVGYSKPISFVFEGDVGGGISNLGLAFDSFTIRATGDTDKLVFDQRFYSYEIPIDFAEIDFGDAGVYPLPYWRTGQRNSIVRAQVSSLTFQYKIDQWNHDGVHIPNFGWWDLKSSVGPVTTIVNQPLWQSLVLGGNTLQTGPLTAWLNSETYPVTVTANITPEPSSFCLCIGSIVLLGIRRRVV